MRILAIDTALPAASVCVIDQSAPEPLALESTPMERGHAEALAPMIRRVIEKVDGGFKSIDRVAVAVGPGSFTGIRIGLAAGQAIAYACGAEIVGVSTLAALAAPFILEPFDGVIAPAIDARHGKVYLAAFGADGRLTLTPRRSGALEAVRALGAGPLKLIGSGAPVIAAEAAARGVPATIVSDQAAPDIISVARLGALARPDTAPPRPLYLKDPDYKPAPAPRAPPTPAPPADADAPADAAATQA